MRSPPILSTTSPFSFRVWFIKKIYHRVKHSAKKEKKQEHLLLFSLVTLIGTAIKF